MSKEFDAAPPDPTEDLDALPMGDGEQTEEETVIHISGSAEYHAADESIWRCERAADLCSFYHITGRPSQLSIRLREWHTSMSSVPETWDILRKHFGICPLLGKHSIEEMRTWTVKEIANIKGVDPSDIEKFLEETRLHWSRMNLQAGLVQRMAATKAPLLDEASKQELLNKYGFGKLKAPEDRDYVINRIGDLSQILEMDEGRPIAISAIFQEILIRKSQEDLMEKMNDPNVDIKKRQEHYASLVESYEKTMAKIGATQEQNPGYRAKVAFNDCVGQITKGIQEYYADGSTAVIDGIHTESEVAILITPSALRPPQYRPDLAILAEDWKKNFWNPNYVAAKLPRKTMRILLTSMDSALNAALGGQMLDPETEPLGDDEPERAAAELEEALDVPQKENESTEGTPDGELPEPAAVRHARNAGNDVVAM